MLALHITYKLVMYNDVVLNKKKRNTTIAAHNKKDLYWHNIYFVTYC